MSDRQTVSGAYAKIEAHEDLCAVRYDNINSSIADLKLGLKWVIGLLVGLLVSVSGYALTEVRAADQAMIQSVRDHAGS
jgi:hypothetical protein